MSGHGAGASTRPKIRFANVRNVKEYELDPREAASKRETAAYFNRSASHVKTTRRVKNYKDAPISMVEAQRRALELRNEMKAIHNTNIQVNAIVDSPFITNQTRQQIRRSYIQEFIKRNMNIRQIISNQLATGNTIEKTIIDIGFKMPKSGSTSGPVRVKMPHVVFHFIGPSGKKSIKVNIPIEPGLEDEIISTIKSRRLAERRADIKEGEASRAAFRYINEYDKAFIEGEEAEKIAEAAAAAAAANAGMVNEAVAPASRRNRRTRRARRNN